MSAPTAPRADVEIVLDLQELRDPPTTPEGYAELWSAVEPVLRDRDLRERRVHELGGSTGTVRVEVVRVVTALDRVDHQTRFGVVGVREAPFIRYRCRQCSASGVVRYGPFICQACGTGPGSVDNRVCDVHVSILDGALTATCGDHRPGCTGCPRPATFRCGGPRCRRPGMPWCGTHRRPHPRDPDLDYCPDCYADLFPSCAALGCPDLGTVRCEHVEAAGGECGTRMCTRHGSRWQVFGGERLGLGRCPSHQGIGGLGPTEILRQIVVGTGRRRSERAPSLRGFAYNLRRCGHHLLARDYDRIVVGLEKVGSGVLGDREVASAVDGMWPRWRREHDDIVAAHRRGHALVDRLRQLVVQHDARWGQEIAATIGFADYVPAVTRTDQEHPAWLFVLLPPHLHGRLKGKGGGMIRRYGDELGVRIRFEEDGPST